MPKPLDPLRSIRRPASPIRSGATARPGAPSWPGASPTVQRSALILPPPPTQEFDRMAREAWEYTQRHYRETGYLPKEELYLRADPVIGKAMWAEDQRAWEEAQERIKARAARMAIVIALNMIARQYAIQLAAVWGTTWSRAVILKQIEDCYKQFIKNGQKNLLKSDAVRGRKLFDDLVDAINNPRISPWRTYEAFLEFLASHTNLRNPDRNLINRIAECIAAKALWFSVLIYLAPGPSGGLSVQTPDFLPAGISRHIAGPHVDREGRLSIRWSPVTPEVADALRIAGISLKLGQGGVQVILDPARLNDTDLGAFNKKVPGVLTTIISGIQTKVRKYENYLGQSRRTTVTLDVTEVPWVLRPEYLRQIRARLWEMDASLSEVYFIVKGEAYRIWPF